MISASGLRAVRKISSTGSAQSVAAMMTRISARIRLRIGGLNLDGDFSKDKAKTLTSVLSRTTGRGGKKGGGDRVGGGGHFSRRMRNWMREKIAMTRNSSQLMAAP